MPYSILAFLLVDPALAGVPGPIVAPPVLPGVVEADGTFVVRLAEPVSADLDPDVYDRLLEDAAGHAPVGALAVEVVARDASGVERPLREILRRPAVAPPPNEPPLRLAPADLPGASPGFLSNRAVYLSQCHGFIYFDTLGRFSTQRGVLFSTVEDFHNPEGADQYLTRYLENAGARVFTARERDINPLMSIADNDGTGYSESGAGFANGAAGFEDTSPYAHGENPFTQGTTRTFPAAGGAVATWTPDVPADGTYAVYVSWDAAPEHASDAHYVITHPGGVIDRWFDQKVHGSTWQYVETLWLTAGSSLTVELVADSAEAGALLSADAVRIGGGMDDVSRHGVTVGRPRWETGAIQYTQFNGAPTSVYDPYNDGNVDDGGSDPTARALWADWEHPAGEDAVYLSWHSNAATGTARGTITYYGGTCSPTAGSYDLASIVQDELIDSIHTRWDSAWYDRGVGSACFAEINSSYNNEMPSILVELAFHDNATDASYLKSPAFREDASRAMYRGIVRYFAQRDGVTPAYLPEPPVGVSLVHEGGELVASWSPGPSGAPLGDPADSYLLYRSADGRAWDSGTPVSGTSTVVAADPNETVFVRIAGVNEGGVSFPSATVGARRSPGGEAPILVVDAFDRLDSGQLDYQAVPNIGTVTRMDLQRMNPGDVAAVHGVAIAGAGWPFDSVLDEALDELDLSRYALVVWATGEESTDDEAFSDVQQELFRDYVGAGGTLWVSGAEILWDLDYRGADTDRAFAEEVLGALMAADAATSSLVEGEGALAGVGPMDFGVEDGAPYPVEWPDVLDSTRPVVARYGDGGVAGVLGDGVAMFGFPFECIGDPAVRVDVAGAIIAALLPDLEPPTGTTAPTEPDDTGGDPAGTTDTDTPGTGGPNPTDPFPALPGPTNVVADGKGCGCGGGSSPGGLGWLALALVLWVRRR